MPRPTLMTQRKTQGSFIAENAAVMVVIFLGLVFPLINLATSFYRYNMLCGASKAGAHAAADALTFLAPPSSATLYVPQTVNNYLSNAKGIQNVQTKFRINAADIQSQTVTHTAWGQPLAQPADPDKYVYTIEVVIDADVVPLVPIPAGGFIPVIPGLTGSTHQTVSAQEVVETISGLNQ